MKVLITSDSHGLTDELCELYEKHKEQVDLFLHCGDSELAPDDPAMAPFKTVQGNCDFPVGNYPNDLFIEAADEKVLVTHGHLYEIKMNPLTLYYKALEANASVVCFGHTHVAGSFVKDGVLFINPGSLRLPRNSPVATYVIAGFVDDKISVEYFDRDGQSVKDLSVSYVLEEGKVAEK